MIEIFENEENRYSGVGDKVLRRGVTTGTCAACAAYACARELLSGEMTEAVRLQVPAGIAISMETQRQDERCVAEFSSCYGVTKYSGDDPDVTDGALVLCCISLEVPESEHSSLFIYEVNISGKTVRMYLSGGTGIGKVTKPGLEIEVGMSAINKVPRQMIFSQVEAALIEAADNDCEIPEEISIIVSIPGGTELAERTFNSSLGIEGGLSILGTTGIIEPMSNRALIESICVQIRQRRAMEENVLYLSPGNHGSKYLCEEMSVDEEDIVKCSNFVGEAIDCAVDAGFEEMVIVGDVGKLCKLAAGIFDTHSHTADGRGTVFALHYLLCGGEVATAQEIMTQISTQAMMDILVREQILTETADSMMKSIRKYVEQRSHNKIKYNVVLFSTKYGLFGEISGEVKR